VCVCVIRFNEDGVLVIQRASCHLYVILKDYALKWDFRH